MQKRRALLVGIEEYGAGFLPLRAVRQDVPFMGKALGSCGYEVEEVLDDQDAVALGKRLREFCEACDEGDVHVIYFSGHGRSVAGKDYLVPARANRDQVDDKENDYSRVKTDFSEHVGRGLVVFIIDACRDGATAKGREEFGHERVGGPRFVRFFGCSHNEICQVFPKGHNGEDISIFSKALGEALQSGQCCSLNEVLGRTTDKCLAITKKAALPVQKPRLSFGEMTAEAPEMLKRRIFDPPVVSPIWKQFDSQRMHCLLIISESESRKKHESEFHWMVKQAMTGGFGSRVWGAFRSYANDRDLINGKRRVIEESPDPPLINLATLAVNDAFRDHVFDDVVRALVEADLVIFDVTSFEPGVLLLMGIRSASRRGVSLSMHGGGWRELDDINVPFNLSDLSLGSHTEPEGGKEEDRVTETLVQRIEYGFRQLAQQPRYQDLPAYDALRQLGPLYEAASTIFASTHVLALASYRKPYKRNWQFLTNQVKGFLRSRISKPEIVRLVDLGNPQLVSQFLYEQIRRTAACIVDWTEYSPSTFFELGVRLAVSEWGAIQVVDDRYLPEGEQFHKWEGMAGQIENMRTLFNPFTYRLDGDSSQIRAAVDLLLDLNPGMDQSSKYDRVYRRVSETIQEIAEAYTPVHKQLMDAADALHNPRQGREGAPQILFRHSGENSKQYAKTESERAARELRIAAWLYMEYRVKAGHLQLNDPLRELYEQLGEESASALFAADEVELGQLILDSLQEKRNKHE